MIVIVTELMHGREPLLKGLHRKARFALRKMLLRPGKEGQYPN
jgi:hypothetical protein